MQLNGWLLQVLPKNLLVNILPQPERTKNIKAILKWLRDIVGSKGATVGQIMAYTETEVTDMGATQRTIRSYIEAIRRRQLIAVCGDGFRLRITAAGRRWLERRGV